MSLFTYAQVMEDIILYRALKGVLPSDGFYIDVGGYHPTYDSVTKLFYDLGWHGINIEPGAKYFPAFETERQRDINLRIAISDHFGEATFFEMDQTSTLEERFASRDSQIFSGEYKVPIKTLTQVCEEHASTEIHFLKIDVEGHEAAVIRGMDFKRFRPWVMVIEAVEPNRLDRPTHHEWEELVLAAGYTFAFTDILNRYYVANEHKNLLQYFGLPADDFHKARDIWRAMEVERQRDAYENRLKDANRELVKRGLQPF
jgi:FkbM family methyltransferase